MEPGHPFPEVPGALRSALGFRTHLEPGCVYERRPLGLDWDSPVCWSTQGCWHLTVSSLLHWLVSGPGASLPQQTPGPSGDAVPAAVSLLLPAACGCPCPTPGLPVSSQSNPSRPFPPACFSGSFVLARDVLRSFPGFTPAQTLCRPWRSHTCACGVCVSHPLSKTLGDFLVLPSECI